MIASTGSCWCFKYEGTWIDCWVEVEKDGKKTRLGSALSKEVRFVVEGEDDKTTKTTGSEVSGLLAFVRLTQNEKEDVWRLALKARGKKSQGQTSIRVTLPKLLGSEEVTAFIKQAPLTDGTEVALVRFMSRKEGKLVPIARLMCKAIK